MLSIVALLAFNLQNKAKNKKEKKYGDRLISVIFFESKKEVLMESTSLRNLINF